jgi:hypothetical protein
MKIQFTTMDPWVTTGSKASITVRISFGRGQSAAMGFVYHCWFLDPAVVGRYHFQVKAGPGSDTIRVTAGYSLYPTVIISHSLLGYLFQLAMTFIS